MFSLSFSFSLYLWLSPIGLQAQIWCSYIQYEWMKSNENNRIFQKRLRILTCMWTDVLISMYVLYVPSCHVDLTRMFRVRVSCRLLRTITIRSYSYYFCHKNNKQSRTMRSRFCVFAKNLFIYLMEPEATPSVIGGFSPLRTLHSFLINSQAHVE